MRDIRSDPSKPHIGETGKILWIRGVRLQNELFNLSVVHFPFLENGMIIIILGSLIHCEAYMRMKTCIEYFRQLWHTLNASFKNIVEVTILQLKKLSPREVTYSGLTQLANDNARSVL